MYSISWQRHGDFLHCISFRPVADLRGLKQQMSVYYTQKRFAVERHHHCYVGDVCANTLESGRDSCCTYCRSGAVHEDDEG